MMVIDFAVRMHGEFIVLRTNLFPVRTFTQLRLPAIFPYNSNTRLTFTISLKLPKRFFYFFFFLLAKLNMQIQQKASISEHFY